MSSGLPDRHELLPVLKEPPLRRAPLSPAMRWLVRGSRLAMFLAAIAVLFLAERRTEDAAPSEITLDEAARLFPTAVRLGPRDADRRGSSVLNAAGETIGFVLKTSPETDHLIGYSGPSSLLLGLDPSGAVVAVKLLWSRDTDEHVAQVRQNVAFWNQFRGWNPAAPGGQRIEGVSGSTLTSLAMAESIDSRLRGQATSLRFPDRVSLTEVQQLFGAAADVKDDIPRSGWQQALDGGGTVLGYVLRTSPFAENVRGYSGPTEALVAIDPSQRTVVGVRLRSSYDTPEYVERVRTDEGYLKSFSERTIDDWAQLDFAAAGIEGVSGATQTSFGAAEGIRRRLASEVNVRPASAATTWWKPRDFGLVAIALGGLLVTFVPAFTGRRVRFAWQLLLVAAFGLWLGDMLSVSLAAGWSRHGVAWSTAPGLVALIAVAFLIPWGTRRQVYCHALCPHGAVQEWLGRWRTLHIRLPRPLSRGLGVVPAILLIMAFGIALVRPHWNLAQIEPFDSWVLGTGAMVSLIVAVVGLVASLFVPQAYCRFGCPTGALLKFVRSHGTAERWGLRDAVAAAAIAAAATWICWPAADGTPSKKSAGPSVLTGRAFGTTWTVKVRDPLASPASLQDDIAAELERIESRLSHWRPGSETSQFNASETTLEIECSRELASLVKQAQVLSEATDGEFDITIGPLVDAWGYGPSGPRRNPPSDETITRLLESTGREQLEVDESVPSLRKRNPAVQVDLGSLLQGEAVDHIHDLLKARGLAEFLVEIGGELRASGQWHVAIDPESSPDGKVVTVLLQDEALSTSGTYRRGPDGTSETKHVISPKTGRPAAAPWIAVSVIAKTCREADGWDTALLVSPNARELATTQSLTVRLVPREGGPVTLGTAWNR